MNTYFRHTPHKGPRNAKTKKKKLKKSKTKFNQKLKSLNSYLSSQKTQSQVYEQARKFANDLKDKAELAGEGGDKPRLTRAQTNDRMKEESMFMLALRIIKILKRQLKKSMRDLRTLQVQIFPPNENDDFMDQNEEEVQSPQYALIDHFITQIEGVFNGLDPQSDQTDEQIISEIQQIVMNDHMALEISEIIRDKLRGIAMQEAEDGGPLALEMTSANDPPEVNHNIAYILKLLEDLRVVVQFVNEPDQAVKRDLLIRIVQIDSDYSLERQKEQVSQGAKRPTGSYRSGRPSGRPSGRQSRSGSLRQAPQSARARRNVKFFKYPKQCDRKQAPQPFQPAAQPKKKYIHINGESKEVVETEGVTLIIKSSKTKVFSPNRPMTSQSTRHSSRKHFFTNAEQLRNNRMKGHNKENKDLGTDMADGIPLHTLPNEDPLTLTHRQKRMKQLQNVYENGTKRQIHMTKDFVKRREKTKRALYSSQNTMRPLSPQHLSKLFKVIKVNKNYPQILKGSRNQVNNYMKNDSAIDEEQFGRTQEPSLAHDYAPLGEVVLPRPETVIETPATETVDHAQEDQVEGLEVVEGQGEVEESKQEVGKEEGSQFWEDQSPQRQQDESSHKSSPSPIQATSPSQTSPEQSPKIPKPAESPILPDDMSPSSDLNFNPAGDAEPIEGTGEKIILMSTESEGMTGAERQSNTGEDDSDEMQQLSSEEVEQRKQKQKKKQRSKAQIMSSLYNAQPPQYRN